MRALFLVLFLIALNNLASSQLPDGKSTSIVAKRVFLKYPSSFMNVTSESWRTQENDDELIIALSFRPVSPVGQVFSVRFIRPDGVLEALLRVTIADENLNVNLYNSQGDEILNKPIENLKIKTTEQNIFLGLNTTSRSLSYRSSRDNDFLAEITEHVNISNREIVVTLGGGGPSMIGCVSLVAVSVGGRSLVTDVNIIDSKDIDDCPQTDACANRDCNQGICKLLEVPTCDCYLTEMTGPNCRTRGSTIRLQNNDEESEVSEYIKFTPAASSREISRLAMSFRFADLDAKEGILIYAETTESEIFKIYVVGRKGTVVVGNENIVDFDLGHSDDQFHTVIVRMNDTSFGIMVDEEAIRTHIDRSIQFETIQFGAPIGNEGVSEVGLTACIKEVYVDHFDIIELLNQNDPRTEATQTQPCSPNDSNDINGLRMFEPDPIIVLDPSKPSENQQVEEDDLKSANLFPQPIANTPKPISKSFSKCEQSQSTMCRHSSKCSRIDENFFKCHCRDGYFGRYCQFSTLPKSCSDARDFYKLPNGPTRIDVDGSGTVEESIAMCLNGTTVVPHDMKNKTIVRDAGFGEHSLFVISYRDFKSKQLSNLIKSSQTCQQSITYQCNKAPLMFETGRTWFKSVLNSTRKIRQMSSLPNSCSCIDGGCLSGGKCNCDSGSISKDEGVLLNSMAGLTEIVTLRNENDVYADISLGSLDCRGYENMKKPIRFVEKTELEIFTWTGESIDIQFRTNNQTATIVRVRGNNDEHVIEVGLLDSHTIIFKHLDIIKTIESQQSLNDSHWHRIIIELFESELRFSLDDKHLIVAVQEGAVFQGTVILSSKTNGMIGCYRSARINNIALNLQSFIPSSSTKMHTNCDSHCQAETCQNNAKCYEDFVVGGSSFCRCAFPGVHSGRNCEIDSNKNTSVAFHGGHLMFDDFPTVLTSSIYFSFRTDQHSGLLFYAHDQNYNFIQVDLQEETRISLTVNNLNIVSTCSIKSPKGTEFGDMQWIQIGVTHTADSSQLQVNDMACTIRTTRSLSLIPIVRFLNVYGSPIVRPPIGLGSQPDPTTPFTFSFIASVIDKVDRSTDGAMSLVPKYESSIPAFLGCFRGFHIGGKLVDLRAKAQQTLDKQLVRVGCDVGCSDNCANGGHCSVAWINNDPTSQKTSCDCSRTSYAGSQCTLDDGIRIAKNGWFLFDIGGVLRPYVNMKSIEPQLFKFAFSIVKDVGEKVAQKKRIARISLFDERRIDVELQPNRTINIILANANSIIDVLNFNGDFSDGYRHFFVAQFHPSNAPGIMIDSLRQDFGYQYAENNFNLIRAKSIEIGANDSDGFEGCASNLLIDFQYGGLLHFTPISYLNISSHHLQQFVTSSSGVEKGKCASFQISNSLPVYRNRVEFPHWETDFRRQIYHGEIEEFGDKDDSEFDKTYGNSLIWVLVICIILLLIALLLFYTFMKCCKEQVHNRPIPYSIDEEEQPLNTLTPTRYRPPQPSPPPQKKSALSNYHLPDPNVDFNREEEEDRNEDVDEDGYGKYPIEDSDTETIRHIDDDTLDGDMVLVSSPSQVRHVPRRVSSFRSTDSTAPPDSPLYSKPQKPKNLVPVPPPRISP